MFVHATRYIAVGVLVIASCVCIDSARATEHTQVDAVRVVQQRRVDAASTTPVQRTLLPLRPTQPPSYSSGVVSVDRRLLLERLSRQQEAYRQEQERFLEARKAFRQQQSDMERKKQMEDRTYAYLVQTVQTLTGRLERLKEWVISNNQISIARKNMFVAKIDTEMIRIRTGLTDLRGASLEQMQAFATVLRTRMIGYETLVQEVTTAVKEDQLQAVWQSANTLLQQLKTRVNTPERSGADVKTAREMIVRAEQKLARGKDRDSIVEAYGDLKALANHLKQQASQAPQRR